MGSFDVAVLLLRVVFGLSLVAHGLNKIRGPRGLAGTAAWFASTGMTHSALQARVASGTEMVAGGMLVVGLLTAGAAAATVSLMVVAIVTVHWRVGYFIFLPNGGWEYCAAFATVATSLAVSGPGRISLDHAWGTEIAGLGGAALIAVGITAAVAHLLVFWRPPSQD